MAKSSYTPGVKIIGLEDVMSVLNEVAPKEARKLARTTIYALAAKVTKGAKIRAPIGDTGVLRKSIYTKSEKSHPDRPRASVRFKDEAWYWRFPEYGTSGDRPQQAQPFLRPARLEVTGNMKQILTEEFQKKLTKRIGAVLRAQAKKNGV